jgi:hypothetical protein
MIAVSNVASQAGVGRFVPKESLQGQRDPAFGKPQSYLEFVRSLIAQVDNDNVQANIARHRKWLTAMRFYMGEQLGFINDAGAWQTINRNPGDPIYVINLVQYFVGALMKDYVRSQVIIDVNARGGKLAMRLAARPAAELLRMVQAEQMGPTTIERDGKFAIIFGNSFRYTICEANAGEYRREPVTEEANIIIGGSAYLCLEPECGFVGDLKEDLPENPSDGSIVGPRMCEQCGSPNIEMASAPQMQVQNVIGFRNHRAPSIDTAIVDPFEIKLPFHAEDLPQAAWMRRERYVDTSKLRATFHWASLMDDTAATNNGESPLLFKRQLEQSPGNVGGQISGFGVTPNQSHLARFRQYWFRPEEYRHFVFQEDTRMANGEVIPSGARMTEIFPTGFYVAFSGNTILETADEDKAKSWVHNRWEVIPDAIWGQGVDHIYQGQELHNEVFSLMFEHLMYNVDPPIVLDPNYLHRSDWSGRPGQVAVLRRGAPAGGVNAAFAQPPPRPLSPDTFGFLELLKGDLQLTAGGAFSTASGLPDVHIETARGMAIQRDQALAMHVSRLKRKAEADVQVGKQQLVLIKKHNLAQFYFPRLSDFSELELQLFAECDVETDLEIVERPQSWMPRSELEKRNDLLEAMTAGGLPMGVFNPAIPRPLRRIAIESFNLPFEGELFSADERNTLLKIYALLNAAPLLQGAPPEMAIMLGADVAPVRYRVDDHQIAIDTVVDFLKTDTGQNLDPVSELLLNDLITRHKRGMEMKLMEDAQSAMMMASVAGMGVAPGMLPGEMPGAPKGGPQTGFSDQKAMSPGETEGSAVDRRGDNM